MDYQEVTFYAGFPKYIFLRACHDSLRSAVKDLKYRASKGKNAGHGRSRALSSFNDLFISSKVIVEKDLASIRVSTSTV